ncbi:hypothetical protein M2165_003815 [Variovorax sp. TBS-050B]|uniref:DUF3014 domain-containing protein n=1 Tax=Variovorax sp. TBS-050B TaxID=2940551 RepID=UPI002476E84F|nr:DUF3014 domain-containing protein [Variovorax sp. TBS-050B]MDH6593926.1 hypothetical protein [Variovorax sp. TBS-050B]
MPEPDIPEIRDTAEAPAFRPRRESSTGTMVVIVLLALAAAFLGWRWYQQQQPVPAEPAPAVAAAPNDGPVVPPLSPLPELLEPHNPLEGLAPPDAGLPAVADSDSRVAKALAEVFGSRNVSEFLLPDGVVRRFVATVDNLPREHAPASRWPVHPAKQRFITGQQGGAEVIDARNAARYAPLVQLAQSVDAAKAAKAYARLYPLFQQAYEELGYPGRYFNDRLVAVIDHLLQAPEPAGPVRVRLVEVKGSVPSQRPWVRYEYADPELEALSSGQKIMVRVGLENERRLKASLRGFRAQIATGDIAKKQKQPSSQPQS